MGDQQESINLPPGFRFHPTDEEIITHYLSPKVLNNSYTTRAIGEVDLNKCEPWDLPSKLLCMYNYIYRYIYIYILILSCLSCAFVLIYELTL